MYNKLYKYMIDKDVSKKEKGYAWGAGGRWIAYI